VLSCGCGGSARFGTVEADMLNVGVVVVACVRVVDGSLKEDGLGRREGGLGDGIHRIACQARRLLIMVEDYSLLV